VAPVVQAVAPVIAPVVGVVAPVVQAVAPVIAPVVGVVAPVVQAVAPVIAPVAGVVAPVAQVIAPIASPLAPVIAPITGTAPGSGTVAPVNGPTGSGEWVGQDPVGSSVVSRAGGAATATAPTASWTQEAADAAEPADGSTSSTAPRWTSPSLRGHAAASQLQTLAASLAPGQSLPTAQAGSAARSGSGGSIPGTPSGPSPCNAGGSGGGIGTGLSSGAWAALPVSSLGCAPTNELRPNRLPTVIWRPTVFLALQERPG
jgi:hypothetical protein